MSSISNIVSQVITLARTAAPLIPGGALISGGIDLGQKILDLVDDFSGTDEAKANTSFQPARQELIAAVTAKANKTAERFEG